MLIKSGGFPDKNYFVLVWFSECLENSFSKFQMQIFMEE